MSKTIERAREIMFVKDNAVTQYLKHLICNKKPLYNYEAYDKQRIELHCSLMREFGFNPLDEKQYERSKYILGNIDRIIQYYLTSYVEVSGRLIRHFFFMLDMGEVVSEKDLDDIQRFICAFLCEEKTKQFIEGTLEPYNEIGIYEYVFVSNLHDYYDRKQRERSVRNEVLNDPDNLQK